MVKNKHRRKTAKTAKKSKLLPRVSEVISSHIETGYNVSKTAKKFGVGWHTIHRILDTPEGKAEINRFNSELSLLKQRARRLIITESLKQFMLAKKHKEKLSWFYALANLTGSTSDVRIAKIQAGVGQGSTESNGGQLSKEEVAYIKSGKKDDKE